MRFSTPGEFTEEERLRQENQELKERILAMETPAHAVSHAAAHTGVPLKLWHPSRLTLWAIFLIAIIVFTGAFFAGYVPLRQRTTLVASEAEHQEQALPRVEVVQVGRSTIQSELQLPGSIQAVTEAPVLARADGYVKRRMVDIGDRVEAGQPLVEIEAPEMDEQIAQAKANVLQMQAALDQAQANYQQGKSDTELARVTAERWNSLSKKGVVSQQENDVYQAQYQSKISSLQSLDKAIAAQRGTVAAGQANVARLEKVQSYLLVKAPFAGVITLRNVDVGALVNTGTTMLFRIAQTDTLRVYVNVPQTHANSIRPGEPAQLTVANLPGRHFTGTVARTASSLDPSSRTMLVEVHVPNTDGKLFPGMYAQVDLSSARANPPLTVPSDALIMQPGGSMVAVVRQDHTVHLQKIEVGRDYGDRLEVINGLRDGDTIIPNPGDVAHEGLKVDPVATVEKK
jgi:RND family efflux transporter MFP subunit